MSGYYENSAITRRPDNLTREILLYGDRYSVYKSAEYQIGALRDYFLKWNDKLISSINPIDAYEMITNRPTMVIRAKYLESDEIDEKTSYESVLAGILNQIHRNYAALARLDEISASAQMYARIAGAERYSAQVLKDDSILKMYGIANSMSELPDISYDSVKKARSRPEKYEKLMRGEDAE